MNRPSFDLVMFGMLDVFVLRGMCKRLAVACMIVRDKRIITSGVNGPNTYDCDELNCDTSKPCNHAIHAEENAITFARKNSINLEGATLYCSHEPCLDCATLIVEAKIKRVVYAEPYRLHDGTDYLIKHDVLTEQFEFHAILNP